MIDLVGGMPAAEAEVRVPACPDWTARDLFSHMVGSLPDEDLSEGLIPHRHLHPAAVPRSDLRPWTGPAWPARVAGRGALDLVPGIGRIRLDKLSPRDVKPFLTEKAETASTSGVAKVVKVSSGAAGERRVPTSDRSDGCSRPPGTTALADVFVIAVLLGLRRGELLDLRWSDLDLDGRHLVVRTTAQRSGGELRVTEPKTRRSARRIRLPQVVGVCAVEWQRVRQARERPAADSAWRCQGTARSPCGRTVDLPGGQLISLSAVS